MNLPSLHSPKISAIGTRFIFSTLCFPIFLFLPLIHSISFDVSYFAACGRELYCEGDGRVDQGALQLTQLQSYRVGRATSALPVLLREPSTGIVADFVTHFSFTVSSSNHSDGLAFFIGDFGRPTPLNSHSGYLGLFNDTKGEQIVMVEFDTWFNEDLDPPEIKGQQHVGININSIKSSNFTPWSFIADDLTNAVITYNATAKNLNAQWRSKNSGRVGNISTIIDLTEVLPDWVAVGFSAATGNYPQLHAIHSWSFSSTLLPKKARGGSKSKKVRTVMVVVCSWVSIIGLMCICLLIQRRWRRRTMKGTSIDSDLEKQCLPRRFNYQELVTATNSFSSDRRLGTGGSGQVYRGILSHHGRGVAVKRIFADPETSERLFINEVQIISRLMHRNLVQFVGWCHEENEFLLVYDYMPNGSLDTHLFGKKSISWNARYKIALGLASALNYLHEDAEQSVLHRDIKSANVLLDTDFTTKLGDFGVAKLVDPIVRTTQTTAVVGTFGYVAPEYMNDGKASKESDIYSFGIVALEIASGRRSFQEGGNHIPLMWWVWKLHVEGKIIDAADERLGMEFDASEMTCLLIVGLWCTNPNSKGRPKAVQVIKVLQNEAPLPTLPHDMHDLYRSQGGENFSWLFTSMLKTYNDL